MQNEKPDTWTLVVHCTVFAGSDWDKQSVIDEGERALGAIFDGTDVAGFSIVDAINE